MRGIGLALGDQLAVLGFTPACAGKVLLDSLIGSPPHTRGIAVMVIVVVLDRFTPAHTGNSPRATASFAGRWVHPRVCGG